MPIVIRQINGKYLESFKVNSFKPKLLNIKMKFAYCILNPLIVGIQGLFGCALGSNCVISLKTFLNKFIVAEDDGTANANGENGDLGTIFVVTFIDGDKVQLKGNQGKYLVAENYGTVNANRDVADTWETWTVENKGSGLALWRILSQTSTEESGKNKIF